MTLSRYHQQLREIQGGQQPISSSGALKQHHARVSRLAALEPEDGARRVVKAVVDACLDGWRDALDLAACAAWLNSTAVLKDAEGNLLSADALAVQWLESLQLVERAETM
jgi:hypothetical protein